MKAPLGLLLAATLAISGGTAAPARAADTEELLGLLIGLGAIYAIGRAIEADNREKARAPAPKKEEPRHVERPRDDRKWKSIPAECLRNYETRNGPVRGVSRRCAERHVHRPERLPEQCELRIRTDDGRRTIYSPRCLRRHDWRIAEAHDWHRDGDRWRRRD